MATVSTRTRVQCVKVSSLRRDYDDPEMDLEKWMADSGNVYVGRPGRIFIGTGASKRIFHYKGSKFANPYKLSEYDLATSLKKYKKHLIKHGLNDPQTLKKLRGKVLGCFCDQSTEGGCHAQILANMADELSELPFQS